VYTEYVLCVYVCYEVRLCICAFVRLLCTRCSVVERQLAVAVAVAVAAPGMRTTSHDGVIRALDWYPDHSRPPA
jgi:hypothetical protein